MQSSTASIETKKEYILNRLRELKKEVQDILELIDMKSGDSIDKTSLTLPSSKNTLAETKNKLLCNEKIELLNKPQLDELLERADDLLI
ncbi:hypothetical protein GWI33_008499 [Rhynchophorus ferrugineus]|uniref:Uncharacterized protein n=1 Tax=Rhynchophorus ferrugineus TaxID=354439 RepID=A0A834IQY3_RHYFE|nr:hypothetical protein GWI33_008499 [Rhynchophorus ferrugineus]